MKIAYFLSKDRITVDPAIMVGKPVVKGTRIPVERVVAHLAHNPDLNDLLNTLRRYVQALGDEFSLKVTVRQGKGQKAHQVGEALQL